MKEWLRSQYDRAYDNPLRALIAGIVVAVVLTSLGAAIAVLVYLAGLDLSVG